MTQVKELIPSQHYTFVLDLKRTYDDFNSLQLHLIKSVSDTQLIVIGGLDNALETIKNLDIGDTFDFDFHKVVYNNRVVKFGFRIIRTKTQFYISDLAQFPLQNGKYYLINGEITKDLPQELLTDLENKKKFDRLCHIIYYEFNEMSDNDDATPYTTLTSLKKMISNDFDIVDIKFDITMKAFTIEFFIKIKGGDKEATNSIVFEYTKAPEEIYILNYEFKGEMFK